jgi:endonuclease/exonuclease/phosphatase family metal-dependent hydrolase
MMGLDQPLNLLFSIAKPFKKSMITLVASLVACLPIALQAQPAGEASLRVMTWNIRYDNAGDGVNAWRHRKDWVAEIIVREKVDILGCQEVLGRQFADLKERLPEMDGYGVGRDDGESSGEFVPIFYRRSRFELMDKGTFWLSTTPDKPGSKSWDTAITRCVSWVKLRDKKTNGPLYVLNAHFDHRGALARRKSAELIVARVKEQFSDHPLIFLGDLNTLPTSVPYQTLTAKSDERPLLRDAYQHGAEKPVGPDSTWNGFEKIVPGNRLDYVFGTGAVKFHSLQTLADQRDGKFPSDHLPVVVALEVGRD